MALMQQEFDVTPVITDDNSNVIHELEKKSYTLLYDDRSYSEDDVGKIIKCYGGSIEAKGDRLIGENIVIIPKNVWDALRNMIMNNYNMTKKPEGADGVVTT